MPCSKTDGSSFDVKFIDYRKEWIDECCRCIETGDEFKLNTDPWSSPFGIWYKNFKPSNNLLLHHLKKNIEPHIRINEIGALVVKTMSQEPESPERQEKLNVFARELRELETAVVRLLEKTYKILSESTREMIVTLECGGVKFGIIVDEVHSVEQLTYLSKDTQIQSAYDSKYINGVGKSLKSEEMILLVDEHVIVDTFKRTNVDLEPVLEKKTV
ncbi:hypothetical protein tpqmel_0319 [Candidatus Gastranaerophilus sp. (ex Termes propinquus)]|nr:hypothetical protein tpqmel_0319 [Candidatus Gastranaerophilus sp. (ex Termes propinquus)]